MFKKSSNKKNNSSEKHQWRTLGESTNAKQNISHQIDTRENKQTTRKTKIDTLVDLENTIRLSVKDMASAIKTTLIDKPEKETNTHQKDTNAIAAPRRSIHERKNTPVKTRFETLADLENTIRLSVKDMVTAVKATLNENERTDKSLPLPKESLVRQNTSYTKEINTSAEEKAKGERFYSEHSEPLNIEPIGTPFTVDNSPEKDFSTYTPFSKFFVGVIAFASFLLIGSILIGAVKIIKSDEQGAQQTTAKPIKKNLETASSATSLGYMISTAKAFLDSKTQADLLRNIREPEIVGAYVYDYYRDNEINFTKFFFDPANHTLTKLHDGHSAIFRVKNYYGDVFPLCVIQKKGFDPKVDWESFVNFSELSWDELLEQQPRSPTLMRAIIEPGTYYNYLYQDDQWQCFRLSDPEQLHSVFVYAKKDSFANKQTIKKLRSSPNQQKPFAVGIFRVFFENGARPNQARLDEVINFGLVRKYQ